MANDRYDTSPPTPSVLNQRHYSNLVPSNSIYIGHPSKWGNPFVIGKDGTREEVIKKYENYLINNEILIKALPELHGKNLVCWCAPLSCHGDILLKLSNQT